VAPGTKSVNKQKDHQADVLQAKVEILSMKIEVCHLERVMMCWKIGGDKLPQTASEYA
jgi:hypothetical protein